MSIYAHYELLIRIRFVIMYGYYSIKNLLGLLQKNKKPPTKLQSQLPHNADLTVQFALCMPYQSNSLNQRSTEQMDGWIIRIGLSNT